MPYRQLAAILFTDIVGYTTLMGSDEKNAFDLLKKSRRIHRRLIRKYRGKWLKEMGDGILASFSSNTDAVMCAISIIKATGDLKIPIRAGIHQGDVIFEQNDVLGDGVNVASRIERFADSSGLVVSETVFNEIRNKAGLDFETIGSQKLKGVDMPIAIYKVICTDFDLLDFKIDTGELVRPLGMSRRNSVIGATIFLLVVFIVSYFMPRWTKDGSQLQKTIMVLPFENYTGSDTLQYITAGLHSSLIGDLGRLSGFRVISPHTSRIYKKSNKTLAEIAKEQNVGYFIDLALLCYGDKICSQQKLISVEEGVENLLWTNDITGEKSQILNINNEIIKEITLKVQYSLKPEEEVLLAESRIVNPEAYEAYLRGMSYMELGTIMNLEKALTYFERASEIDPKFALAYLGMSQVNGAYAMHGFKPFDEVSPIRVELLNRAYQLDSMSAEIRTSRGNTYIYADWNWDMAGLEFKKALEINPNYPFGLAYYSHYLILMNKADEGLEYSEKAMQLDPLNSLYQSIHLMALKNSRKFDEALKLALELEEHEPGQGIGLPAIWAVYHELGRFDEAYETAKRVYQLRGKQEAIKALDRGYAEGGYKLAMQRVAEMMIAQSDSVYYPPWQICTLYCRAEMDDEAIFWLEKAYVAHDQNMPYIKVDPLFDFLRDKENFRNILERMNLPSS